MQKKQGISLIVLVITIIVMIILAGAIILSLNNSGIINNASEAVEKSDEANIRSIVQTYWAEAYAEAIEDNVEITEEELQERLNNIITKNKFDTKDFVVKATTSGVVLTKGWKQEGLTVRKGNKVLNIGDKFVYDETPDDDSTITVEKDVEWKVLGANYDGELLIMSTSDVSYENLGEMGIMNVRAWLNGPQILDSICEQYGHGKNATGARSIRIEDVDKITGYDKTTYGKGEIYEYGNEITYSYAGEGKIKSYSSNTKKEEIVECSNFYYLDKTNKRVEADLKNGTGVITTIKSNFYEYEANESKIITAEDEAYKMLFGSNDTRYWLASQLVSTGAGGDNYGIGVILTGTIACLPLWSSSGTGLGGSDGVRAVVSLAPDIQVGEYTEAGWTY